MRNIVFHGISLRLTLLGGIGGPEEGLLVGLWPTGGPFGCGVQASLGVTCL